MMKPVPKQVRSLEKSREQAVALQYSELDELPRVIASGQGEIARKILELALENNIPIYEDETLAKILSVLGPKSPISEESFRLVAEIISFLYHTDREWREKHEFLKSTMLESP